MKNHLCFLLLFLFSPGFALAAEPAKPSPFEVRRRAEQAVAVRVETQKKLSAFQAEESKMLDRLEILAKERKLVSFQRQKTEAYIRDQRAKVAELKRRLAENARIRAGLEALLDRGARELQQASIAAPYHFLPKDTQESGLQAALNDYDLGLAQKTKRVFDALAAEARRGQSVRVWEAPVEIAGKVVHVKLIRLGRLALFALDHSGQRAWRYSLRAGGFESVDGWARDLSKLTEIVQRQRIASLVKVPLPRESKGQAR